MDNEIENAVLDEDMGNEDANKDVKRPLEDLDTLTQDCEHTEVDCERLHELNGQTEKGVSQLASLVKHWEYRQANAVRLLQEELDNLSKQRQEVELKKLEILEEHRFEEDLFHGDKQLLEDLYDLHQAVPKKKDDDDDAQFENNRLEMDAEYDTVSYWKQKAMLLEKKLEDSIRREEVLTEKLQESIRNVETRTTPVEELSQMLNRADSFIHFILQNAPIVLGHMDKELRYRFIYNHFPSFKEEDFIEETNTEILSGAGVRESLEFKREVLERGLPGKREITFETELYGLKTFLMYVEPVFNKIGETIGVNYIGMDITDQVRKREKMAKLREEIAVQKAMETELNKTIRVTEETMRAKQMLATMSHEIRSPLSGVVSMAEILATTNLNQEQRKLLDLMISSGDLALQLINDILDFSKVQSGVMKLEATKFHPREVVRHVLQTAAASLRKELTLEGLVADDIPVEVVGDVLRFRQILTNLVSNAIKFTQDGKVGIKLHVEKNPDLDDVNQNYAEPQRGFEEEDSYGGVEEKDNHQLETTVWIRCDVYDTGIGIPEHALPALFKQYTQASADHARKYGGTGLGLAICKQLVELMGGHLTVTSKEHSGSTFTFALPYRVSVTCEEHSDDSDALPNDPHQDIATDKASAVYFHFRPQSSGSGLAAGSSGRNHSLLQKELGYNIIPDLTVVSESSYKSLSSTTSSVRAPVTLSDPSSPANVTDVTCSEHGNSEVQNSTYEEVTKGSIQNEDSQMQTAKRSPLSREVNHSPKKPKILLVEDNKINVMIAETIMKQLGHSIDVVNNGAEAVRAVQRQSYDLIFMDVCMPVMDGLEATRIIRAYEDTGSWHAAAEAGIHSPDPPLGCQDSWSSHRRVAIIAMTANALSESAEECYANGMDSFVSKPVTSQILRQCLEEYSDFKAEQQ